MTYLGARSAEKGRCVEEEAEGGDEGALVVCEELDACRPIVKVMFDVDKMYSQ